VRSPQDVDMVIFRENTEDIYAGVEWRAGSPEAKKLIAMLQEQLSVKVREGSGVGIKPMSPFGSKRLVAFAIRAALQKGRGPVTLVHKGNIQKFTEGAFRDWGYEVAAQEFGDKVVAEKDLAAASPSTQHQAPSTRLIINDRIADSMFQQLLLRPREYSILATPNLNGDYLSDACAAQVGGLGIAPGANIGDGYAIFEATHGTAPKYADQDKINPGSVILSGVMMFEHLGWEPVATSIIKGVEGAIGSKRVTYDLARQTQGATEISTSAFADNIIEHLG
jgi:isocitrate dehydrogenase